MESNIFARFPNRTRKERNKGKRLKVQTGLFYRLSLLYIFFNLFFIHLFIFIWQAHFKGTNTHSVPFETLGIFKIDKLFRSYIQI